MRNTAPAWITVYSRNQKLTEGNEIGGHHWSSCTHVASHVIRRERICCYYQRNSGTPKPDYVSDAGRHYSFQVSGTLQWDRLGHWPHSDEFRLGTAVTAKSCWWNIQMFLCLCIRISLCSTVLSCVWWKLSVEDGVLSSVNILKAFELSTRARPVSGIGP